MLPSLCKFQISSLEYNTWANVFEQSDKGNRQCSAQVATGSVLEESDLQEEIGYKQSERERRKRKTEFDRQEE